MKTLLVSLVATVFVVGCGAADGVDSEEAPDVSEFEAVSVDPTVPIAPDLNKSSDNSLGELSGMVRSQKYPGFIWMHRDGYAPNRNSRVRLYAMKIANRKLVSFPGSSGTYPTREWTFNGVGSTIKNNNWEEMGIGPDVRNDAGSSLYIGDIGNNGGGRNSYQVYQVAEPDPTSAATPALTVQATWKFQYPSSAQISSGEYPNCETMFVLDRYIYIVTKESSPRVYRFPNGYFNDASKVYTLVQVVNGGTTHVVGAQSNPSYGQFSDSRERFVLGSHQTFKVWALGPNAFTGDALVQHMLLTPALKPAYSKVVDPTPASALNTEGATWELGTLNLVFGTESKMVYHWPQANYQQ